MISPAGFSSCPGEWAEEQLRAPGTVVKKPILSLQEKHMLPKVVVARGRLLRSPFCSGKGDRDEERHTGPLRTNWWKKNSVFKFSADEEGKNSLQHLVYIMAFCFSRGCVYSEAPWCIARGVLKLLVSGGLWAQGMPCSCPHVLSLASLTDPIQVVEQRGVLVGPRCLSTELLSSRALQQCSLSWLLPILLILETEANSPLIEFLWTYDQWLPTRIIKLLMCLCPGCFNALNRAGHFWLVLMQGWSSAWEVERAEG